MDDLISEIFKGFFRVIGYILAEVFFGTVCYWVGWPICKLVTLGKYPSSQQVVYLGSSNSSSQGFWCSSVGLIFLIVFGLFAAGLF
jgi:hypothetical protein